MEKNQSNQKNITRYLNFENKQNLCWIHSTIALIVHNKTFKKFCEDFSESEINKMITSYSEAIDIINDCDSELEKCKVLLRNIQTRVTDYLQPIMQFEMGKPDSAFCALLNIIQLDQSKVKDDINIVFFWERKCSKCGTSNSSMMCKPIITLANAKTFNPKSPSISYVCDCKSVSEMKLIYKELPPCLIFHFEKGSGSKICTSFYIKDRKFELTGILVLRKNPNHFFSYSRNPITKFWIKHDDLKCPFTEFRESKPDFKLSDLYIVVYETFDNTDRIITDAKIEEIADNNTEIISISDSGSES